MLEKISKYNIQLLEKDFRDPEKSYHLSIFYIDLKSLASMTKSTEGKRHQVTPRFTSI